MEDNESNYAASTSQRGAEEGEQKETEGGEGEDPMQANMAAAEKELKEMLLIRMASEMKFESMDVYRRPPDTGSDQSISSDTKIASLEPIVEDEEMLEDVIDDRRTCNNALLNYFATLGEVGNKDNIDLPFLDVLCEKADVNIQDMHGQTILHEVARDWSTDIAIYLLAKGAKCDVTDQYGRTPLFVAAASNHTKMIMWLVDVGVDLNHKTMKGEEQLPIHYAAKNGAIAAFNLLVKLGANPLARDGNGRTPFYLAAAAGKRNICEHFLYKEFPVVSFTRSASSTIDQIIENLPSILVHKALNQFIVESKSGLVSKYLFHLNCLGKKRWRLINKNNPATNNLVHQLPLYPLDRIIRRNDLSLITHPLILELLKLKSQRYGNKWSRINVTLTILFTILWTASASIRVNEMEDLNAPPVDQLKRDAVLGLTVAAQCLTFMFMFKAFYEWKTLRKMEAKEKDRGTRECEEHIPYCHPRWINDISLLEKRLKGIESMSGQFWTKDGIFVEIICLLMCTVYFILTLIWYKSESTEPIAWLREARMIYSLVFVLILFLRANGCFHAFQTLGLFVTMIGKIPIAGFQIMFLFFEFFIPFSVSFWVSFGGTIIQENEEYQTFQNLLYQLWLMSFVGDYELDALSAVNDFLAELFVSLYFILLAIITINIYVAFLTEVFAAVSQEATEKAYMAEARFCQSIELIFPHYKYELEIYLNEVCAPMAMEKDLFVALYKSEDGKNPRAQLKSVRRELTELNADMKVLLATEETALRNSKTVVKKVEDLNESYNESHINEIHRYIRKVMGEQKRPIVKGITIATNKIFELIRQVEDLL